MMLGSFKRLKQLIIMVLALPSLIYLCNPEFCTASEPFDPQKNGPRPNTWNRYESTPSLPIRALSIPGTCQFNADNFTSVPLLAKVAVSPTSFVLRFGLPDKTKALNLSTCSCLLVGVSMKKDNGDTDQEEMVIRPYTPISTNAKIGIFDLLIKRYDQGRMSSYLTSLQPSSQTFVSFKHIPLNVKIQYPFGRPKFIGLIAGGTGITPMIQALHALLDPTPESSDKETEQVVLLYGSKTKDDILADTLVNSWASMKNLQCKFSVVHVLSNEVLEEEVHNEVGNSLSPSPSVQYCKGHINRDMIEAFFPGPEHDILILICGPPAMYQSLCGPRNEKEVSGILGSMGYQSSQQPRYKMKCHLTLVSWFFLQKTSESFVCLKKRTNIHNLFSATESFQTSSNTANKPDDSDDAFIRNEFNFQRETGKRVVGPTEVIIYCTTLRDGTQGESVSVSCNDKLKIASRLSSFGVDYIEAGWPGSNPKDAEFFHRARTELNAETKRKLVAFGSTRRKNTLASDDPQIQALVASDAPTICMVAKAHLWQVTDIIRATAQENLDMIHDSIAHLRNVPLSSSHQQRQIFVDLEHFFDGYKFDPSYALECCRVAVEAGALGLVLCDTNGGTMPWEVAEITRTVVDQFHNVTVGIHAHNDCGMAVANSIIAAKSGAGLIQGTINGVGERTGNANLCSIVPSLALHVHSKMSCRHNLKELTNLSRFVDETMNRQPDPSAPYVGSSAFAHKGGLHVAAMERSPMSYQHIDPSLVGNEKRILISELSGRQNIIGRVKGLMSDVDGHVTEEVASERAIAILNRVKQLENIGYTFEGAEASVDLMILHSIKEYCIPFRVIDYSVQVFDSDLDPAYRSLDQSTTKMGKKFGPTARATVQLRTASVASDEDYESGLTNRLEVSDGQGPVDALSGALKRALIPSYPYIKDVELVDYKVRILDPQSATAAATRVMIEFRDIHQDKRWTTVSVDRNIISASLNALVDGFEYALVDKADACLLDF